MFNVRDKVRRNVLVSSDQGLMIVNRFDCNHEQVGHGQWLLDHGSVSSIEANETYQCLKHLETPVIFDVGANIGTYTTWIAQLFPRGKVYCFEPQRLVFQMLCGNLAINNFDNCYAYNMALGNVDSILEFEEPDYYQKEDFGTFSLIEDKIKTRSEYRHTVNLLTLDSFTTHYKVDKVDFIKIDVEGMDLDVLKGGKKTLETHRPSIFIEHSDNRKSILNDIVEYLGINNYTYKVIGNNLLAIPR